MKILTTPRLCACGNLTYWLKWNCPVCERCHRLEELAYSKANKVLHGVQPVRRK